MNQTPNTTNTLTVDEIASLHGDDLKKALDQQVQQIKDEASKIHASLKDVCDKVKQMPEVDVDQINKKDDEALAKMKEDLDNELNEAAANFATEDKLLKDINNTTDEEEVK